jgi:hypothetical protein
MTKRSRKLPSLSRHELARVVGGESGEGRGDTGGSGGGSGDRTSSYLPDMQIADTGRGGDSYSGGGGGGGGYGGGQRR